MLPFSSRGTSQLFGVGEHVPYRSIAIGLVVLGTAVVLAFSVTPASVAQDTCDVTVGTNIQDAIDAAEPGDTICLEDGTYEEELEIGIEGLSLVAEPGATPVFDGGGSGTAILVENADSVTIQGLTIQNYGTYGIHVRPDGHNITIQDNHIENSGRAIWLRNDGVVNAVVHGNTIVDNGVRGIQVGENNENASIRDNVIEGNSDAITLRYAPRAVVENNTIEGGGISVWDEETVVRDNEITNGGTVAIRLSHDGDDVLVENNTINDTPTAIQVSRTGTPEIRNNSVSGSQIGLSLELSDSATIVDNELDTGITIEGDASSFAHFDHVMSGNTVNGDQLYFVTGETSPEIPAGVGQIIVVDSTDVDVSGFEFDGVASGIQIAWSSNVTVQNNTVTNSASHAIRLWNADEALVTENEVHGNGQQFHVSGIGVHGSPDSVVTNNTVTDNDRHAVRIGNSPDVILDGNVISNNSVALGITGSDRVVVTNNTITDTHHGGGHVGGLDSAFYIYSGEHIEIRNNTIADNLGNGIHDNRGTHAQFMVVENNEIVRNGQAANNRGLHLHRTHDATIRNNIITDNGATGIAIGMRATVINNTVKRNGGRSVQVSHDSSVVGNLIENNSGIALDANAGVEIRENTILDNGEHGIWLRDYDNQLVENNTVSGHVADLTIYSNEFVTVRDNTFDTGVLFRSWAVDFDELATHEFINNTVSGSPLVHLVNESNVVVDGEAGQVIVVNSTNITITEQAITGTVSAIQVAFSNQTTLTNSTLSASAGGFVDRGTVTLWESHHSTIQDNAIIDNLGTGIEVIATTGTDVLDNLVMNTDGVGILVDGPPEGTAVHNNSLENNDVGVQLDGYGWGGPEEFLNATDNWWGDDSGPSGDVEDPETGTLASGNGDEVGEYVRFDPWLTTEPNLPDPAFFELTEVDANDTVLAGDTLQVNVTVTNTGELQGTQTIELEDDSNEVVNASELTLEGGENETLSLFWETSDDDIGEGDLTVSSDDDQVSVPVSVLMDGVANITSCGTLTVPGEYHLQTDLTGSQTCLDIAESGIEFDGMGHTIRGVDVDGTGTQYGLQVVGATNVSVSNVTISDWEGGLYLDNVDDSVVSNVVVEDNGVGMRLRASNDNSVSNLTTRNNAYRGLHVGYWTASHGNTFTDIVATGNEDDQSAFSPGTVYMQSGSNNEFVRVTASDNQAGVTARAGNNHYEDIVANDNSMYGVLVESNFGTTLDNISVSRNGWQGLLFDEGHGNTVTNVTATENYGTGVRFTGDFGSESGSTGNVLTGVYSADNDGAGVAFSLSDYNELYDLELHNNTGSSVDVVSRSEGNHLEGVRITDGWSNGIYVRSNDNYDNSFVDVEIVNTTTGLSIWGETTTVETVTIQNVSGTAITIRDSFDPVLENAVSNVTIDGAGGDGLVLGGEANNTASGLDITGVAGTGIVVVGGDNAVSDATVTDSGDGLELRDARDVTVEAITLGETTISVSGRDVVINGTDAPAPAPEGTESLGTYLDVTSTGEFARIDHLEVAYDETNLGEINETSLRIWRHHNGTWRSPAAETYVSGYDTGAQFVFASNVTAFDSFGVLGETDPDPVATGTLTATVVDANTTDPIANATVLAYDGDTGYADIAGTDVDGNTTFELPVGTYTLEVEAAGYLDGTLESIEIGDGATEAVTVELTPQPGPGTLSGTVTDAESGNTLYNAGVTVTDPQTGDQWTDQTDWSGDYEIALPAGTYEVRVDGGFQEGGVYETKTIHDVSVGWEETTTLDVEVDQLPAAAFIWEPDTPLEGESVRFDASASTPPAGVAMYGWDFNGNGSIDLQTDEPVVNHTYEDSGTYDVTLHVMDNWETTHTATEEILVRSVFAPVERDSRESTTSDTREITAQVDDDGTIIVRSTSVPAGTDVRITIPEDEDLPVDIDQITFTTVEDTALNFEIHTDVLPPTADATAFERADGTRAVTYHQIDHSIPEDAVTNVRFHFVMDADALEEDEEPDHVALYRLQGGEWAELDTEVTNETDDRLWFDANSPGLSEFATGVKQTKFEISQASISISDITVGDTTEITVQIHNAGGIDGMFVAELWVDGELADDEPLSIAAGGTRQHTFEHTFVQAGTYEILVNDYSSGEIRVAGTGEVDGATGAVMIVAVLALLAAAAGGAFVLYKRMNASDSAAQIIEDGPNGDDGATEDEPGDESEDGDGGSGDADGEVDDETDEDGDDETDGADDETDDEGDEDTNDPDREN